MSPSSRTLESLVASARNYLPATIFAAFSGSFVLRITAVLFGFFSSVIIARWLEPQGFGRYSYALAWANLLFVPAMLGTDKLLIRELAIYADQHKWSALKRMLRWGRVRCTTSAFVVAAVFALVVWQMGEMWPSDRSTSLLAAPLILLLAASRFNQSVLQGYKRILVAQLPESVIRPLLLMAFVGVLAGLIGIEANSAYAMLANITAAGIAVVAGSLNVRRFSPAEKPKLAPYSVDPRWAASALPLLIVGVIQTANAQASLLILGSFSSAEELGLYSVALRLASLLGFFLIAFNSALAPHYAALFAARRQQELQRLVTNSARLITALTIPAAVGMIVLGPFLLSWFGPKYVAAFQLLIVLVIAMSVSNFMGAVGLLLTMTGHERDAVTGLVVALLFNVLLLAVLVPRYGPLGAAYSTLIYMIVWNTAFAIFVYRRTGIVPSVIGSLKGKQADGDEA